MDTPPGKLKILRHNVKGWKKDQINALSNTFRKLDPDIILTNDMGINTELHRMKYSIAQY